MARKEKKDDRPVIIIQPDMSPITLEVYAERTGQKIDAVRKQHQRQVIPTFQMGKSSTIYVNQAKMLLASLEAADWDVRVPRNIYETAQKEAARYA